MGCEVYTAKVTDGDHPGSAIQAGGGVPVRGGGQLLAGEFGVGGGFEPTDAGDRKILLPGHGAARFPGGGAWPAGGIVKLRHGLLPRKFLRALREILLPEAFVAVPTGVHKLLELAIRDFITIDCKRRDTGVLTPYGPRYGNRRLGDKDHSGGRLSRGIEVELLVISDGGSKREGGAVAGFEKLPPVVPARHVHVLQRRAAEKEPLAIRGVVILVEDLGSGGHGIEGNLP